MMSEQKYVCMINTDSPSFCTFPTYVGIHGSITAIGFIIGEWYFGQISDVQSRKFYLILDMGISALWALFYATSFIMIANSWRKADTMFAFAQSNILGAIIFSFLSIFCWSALLKFSYRRYQMGSIEIFSQGLCKDVKGQGGGHHGYQDLNGYCDPPSQVKTDLLDEDKIHHPKDFNHFTNYGYNII